MTDTGIMLHAYNVATMFAPIDERAEENFEVPLKKGILFKTDIRGSIYDRADDVCHAPNNWFPA